MLEKEEEVKSYLVQKKWVEENECVQIERLSGGVSNQVWKIVTPRHRWVMKQASPKLRVQEDWFSGIERIYREQKTMRVLGPILKEATVPQIVHSSDEDYIYVMTCAPEQAVPWKAQLLKGQFQPEIAQNAGRILREIHLVSQRFQTEKEEFLDQTYFDELRLDPYFRFLIPKYPELEEKIRLLIRDLTQNPVCLVHGDFSPKNMLVTPDNKIILIDYEVAHWGNPIFDVAFCLTHLLLKGWHLRKEKEGAILIQSFLESYRLKTENLLFYLGFMLLARLDGKSPVEYLQDPGLKQRIRKQAIRWIQTEEKDALQQIRLALEGNLDE